jgi:hypothetical protein
MQAKSAVGTPGDAHEREADQIAERIMQGAATVQQKCTACGEGVGQGCACAQRKALSPTSAPASASVSPSMREGGQPLSPSARGFFEPQFGYDFSQVRIHSDPEAAQVANAFQAEALTTGRHIWFGAGRYDPMSATGRKLLAHELAHVVHQSSAADCTPSLQLKGRGPGSCGWTSLVADTTTGKGAHEQIQDILVDRGFGKELPIPRGSKFSLGLGCRKAGTPRGAADVMRPNNPGASLSEIKPYMVAKDGIALAEASHYVLRARQSQQRLNSFGQCRRQDPDSFDFTFDATVNATRGARFSLLKGAIKGEEDFGTFKLDPRRNLKAKELTAGAIGYWCVLNDDGKKRKKEEKEKEKEKKEKEKEKGKAGGGNFGIGISILGSSVGGGNVGVGISVGSNTAAVGTASLGVSWFSDSAGALAAGAAVSKDSQSAGALTVSAGEQEGSTSVGAVGATAGRQKESMTAGVVTAAAGEGESNIQAGAVTATRGDVSGSIGAQAVSKGSGTVEGAQGAGSGSPPQGFDPADATAPGADRVPAGQSDEEVMAAEERKECRAGKGAGGGGTKPGGTPAGTSPTGGGAGQKGPPQGAPGVQQSGGTGGTETKGTPGAPGATGRGASKGQPGKKGLAVFPIFPPDASQADRDKITEESKKVAALLQNASDAQKLFMQDPASRSSGEYRIPASEWVDKLMKATEGLKQEEIERLKDLDWKPGHVSVEELRERIRKALARKTPAQPAEPEGGKRKKPGEAAQGERKAGTGAAKHGKGEAGEARRSEETRAQGGRSDTAKDLTGEAKQDATADFMFVIVSGMDESHHPAPGQSVPCTIHITEPGGRDFILDNVSITYLGRTDTAEPGGGTHTMFRIRFTKNFWSEKFKFHGLGGYDIEYSFGKHKPRRGRR